METNNPIENAPNDARKTFIVSFRRYIRDIFDVKSEVDFVTTAENVKKDVVFKGFNIWILILSILICSIGLNLNSTAIVIGAMLISPLMGPITGLGFAVGTFDRDLLVKALMNLAIALVISILASFLFFKIAPNSVNQSELLSRTKPGVMDLLVATFGGFAGILAGARNIKTNVIPGVAIATALMPPLCTAGFGLATGNMDYFLGAFYLFFINSVFISLSALVVIRYLKFPIVSYVDLKTRRRVRLGLAVFITLVSVPSVIIYSKALKQSLFELRAKNFVEEVINSDNRQADNLKIYYSDTSRQISIWVYGDEFSIEEEDSLQSILPNHGMNKTRLDLRNMGNYEQYKTMFDRKDQEITQKTSDAQILQEQLLSMQRQYEKQQDVLWVPQRLNINVKVLGEEADALFRQLKALECVMSVHESDTNSREIPVFLAHWKSRNTRSQIDEEKRLGQWLKTRYTQQFDSIRVVNIHP